MDKPKAVAFDIVETTISLDGLRPRLAAGGLSPGVLEEWFAGLLRDAFALDAIGIYRSFPEIARATLAARGLDDDAVDHVLAGFAELEAHPDAAAAMGRLRDGGLRVCALTNGSAEVTERMLDRNGLLGFVEEIVTIGEISRWKPAREVYEHAAGRMGLDPREMALFAAHPWDCAGAAHAGYATGYVARGSARWLEIMPRPDVVAPSLAGLAEAFLGR